MFPLRKIGSNWEFFYHVFIHIQFRFKKNYIAEKLAIQT